MKKMKESNELKKALERVDKRGFREDLVGWFREEQRDLPWRKTRDPYQIWVSEVMLQQTRVDTVIPYYNKFMKRFPTMEDFAAADEEVVLKIWEGLGYYSRVRNLHKAMKEVVDLYDGKVPDTRKEISGLKGVGPYTAGAILSIAYGKPEHAVDGNVMRVLSRILLISEDIAKPASRRVFEQAVDELMDSADPSYFNQGLMELGALICTPRTPTCLLCPVREHCLAFEAGVQEKLPVKSKKKPTRHEDLLAVVLRNGDKKFLVHKRPDKGLLAGLWEFPNVKGVPVLEPWESLQDFIMTETGLNAEISQEKFMNVKHMFTHLTWSVDVYEGDVREAHGFEDSDYRFVTEQEMDSLAFPVSHQNIWKAYKEQSY